ncbi:MAG: DMT family transporter [Ferruginibacter sp.]
MEQATYLYAAIKIMNNGYMFAFITLASWTVSTFVLAKLSRLEAPAVINKSALFVSTFLLAFVVCIRDGLNPVELFTKPYASNWIWLGISGIIGKSIGDYLSYDSLRILGARRRTMITTLTPGFAWIFGWLFLNESINLVGMAAMLLTITALLLMINSQSEREEVKKENYGRPLQGLLFGIAASALTGLAFILSKKTFTETGKNISEFHGTWIRILTAFTTLLFFDIGRNKHTAFIKPFLNMQKGGLLFTGVLFGAIIGLSFSLMAITRMNTAVAFTIFALLPVSIMLVSVTMYGKKVTTKSYLYSLLAIAGVMLLIWRNHFK